MRAWTLVSAVAVHHGWAKEPSDSTLSLQVKTIVYDKNIKKHISFIAYDIIQYIVYDIVKSLSAWQAVGKLSRKRGEEDINIHLLKPAQFAVDPLYSIPPTMSASGYIVEDDSLDPGEEYLTYAYRTSHQVLRWLPTKLAVDWSWSLWGAEYPWQACPLWTAFELNAIITGNHVGGPHGHLHTFGCIQWENELFSGRPKTRCNPFNFQGHCFRNKNPQVHYSYRIRYQYHYRVALALYRTRYSIRYRIRYHNDVYITTIFLRRRSDRHCDVSKISLKWSCCIGLISYPI